MSHVDRGMVRYAPYQSLVEQSSALARMREERSRVERKILSPDEAEAINEILTHYEGEEVRLSYWKMGRIFFEEGIMDQIDVFARVIYINGLRVSLASLQSLERK